MINRDLKNAGTKLLSWCAAKRRARSNKIWPKQKQIHWLSTCCSFQKTKQNKTKQKLKTFTIFYQLYFPDCIQVWKLLGKFQDFLKNSRFFTNIVLILSWTFALSNQTGEWHAISMEFLQWFPRRYFARKPEVASQNFVCFLRLLFHISFNTHTCTNKVVFTWHQGDFRPGNESTPVPSHGSIFVYMIPQNVMPTRVTPAWVHPGSFTGARISPRYEILQRYHVNAKRPPVSVWNRSAGRLERVAHAQCLRFWITRLFYQHEVYLQISRY